MPLPRPLPGGIGSKEPLEHVPQRATGGGLLCDMVQRLKGADHRALPPPEMGHVSTMSQRSKLDFPVTLHLNRRDKAKLPDALLDELYWERLVSSLDSCVSPQIVRSAHPSKVLFDRAVRIAQLERQVSSLDRETETWLVLYDLMHKTAVHKEETQYERAERLQQFWMQFHHVSRRGLPGEEDDVAPVSLFTREPSMGGFAVEDSVVDSAELDEKLDEADPSEANLDELVANRQCKREAAFQATTPPRASPTVQPRLQRPSSNSGARLPRLQKRVGHKEAVKAHGRLEGLGIDSLPGSPQQVAPERGRQRGTLSRASFSALGGSRHSLGSSVSLPNFQRPRPNTQGSLLSRQASRWSVQDSSSKSYIPSRPSTVQPLRRPILREKFPQIERSLLLQAKVGPKPPVQESFGVPWDVSRATTPAGNFPVKRYVNECQTSGIVLGLLPFVTGHSEKLSAGNRELTDTDLAAITSIVPGVPLKDVDLEGNLLLSDRALEAFLRAVTATGPPQLRRLSLHRCVGMGALTTSHLTTLLRDGEAQCPSLRHLDLGGVSISMRCHLPLCRAVREHGLLISLCLAGTGLGSIAASLSAECITELLECHSLEKLDLGWNCFSTEVFTHLGERLAENHTLRSLLVGNCASAVSPSEEAPGPVMFFMERLGRCASLQKLDLSLNRMGYQGGLILEDQLEKHASLRELIVSHNPLGATGMRSLFRLLMRPSSNLKVLTYEKCVQRASGDSGRNTNVFSATRPGGKYVFNFARPYDRALLRMLYKACERLGMSPQATFTTLSASPPYSHPAAATNGTWQVPTSGKLIARFSLEGIREGVLKTVEERDFSGFLQKHFEVMRSKLAFKKVIPILANFKMLATQLQEQVAMLDVISRDFLFGYPSMRLFCQRPEVGADVLERLLPSVSGGQEVQYLTRLLVPSINSHMRLRNDMKAFLAFNPDVPTGHYRLDLAIASDYAVAERLLLLDRWEAGIEERTGRVDLSCRGGRSHLREEWYQQDALPVEYIQEWFLPERGVFEFDYVSGQRPLPGARPLGVAQLQHVMLELQRQARVPAQRTLALRAVAHKLFLKASQLRELLAVMGSKEDCVELVVLLFFRLVDPENEKLFRVYLDDQKDVYKFWNRLGNLPCFPFMQPEQATFEFHFNHRDHRLAANVLFQIAEREGMNNMKDIHYVLPDGTVDPLPLGVPRSWMNVARIPNTGMFTVRYGSSPEDRKFELRRRLASTYGYWQINADENGVHWSASLNDCPKDVFSFIDFLRWHFATMKGAFTKIAGYGNAFISMTQFEMGMDIIQCNRFAGPDENNRIREIFRYLDRNQNGKISQKEFVSLDMFVWEIRLIVQVFVQVMGIRSDDDSLQKAWRRFDPRDAGSVQEEHWRERCKAAGYHGPARPVFNFLDWRLRGRVSRADFSLLQVVWRELPERYHADGGPYSLLPAKRWHRTGRGRRRAASR